ncbi:hypothetical protein THAR02_11494, partial [Trichoderma harzianum]
NCRAPKKERKDKIPEPKKENLLLEREERSLDLLQREDDSYPQHEEELGEITEPRGTTPLENTPNPVRNPAVEATAQRNYGLPSYERQVGNITNFVGSESEEINELIRLQQRVEIHNPERDIETLVYREIRDRLAQWQPYNDKQRIIASLDADEIWELEGRYQRIPRDHPWIDPANDNHHRICWTNCIAHRCMYHLKWKAEHNTFPRRNSVIPITDPCHEGQHSGWKVTYKFRELRITILEPHPTAPYECKNNGRTENCPSHWCTIHQTSKLIQWHDQNEGTRACTFEWYRQCDEPDCLKHRRHKLEDWHDSVSEEKQAMGQQLVNQLHGIGFNFRTHIGAPEELLRKYHEYRKTPDNPQDDEITCEICIRQMRLHCGAVEWENCANPHCKSHALRKIEDWHSKN